MTLMDPAFSRTALVKGERLMREIRKRIPDVRIEDLPIPFTAVATDLYTGEEVLFREGPLIDAVRASISIPSMFVPVRMGTRMLIDGGICNTFPLNRAIRTEGDILVGFNVNEIDAGEIRSFLESRKELVEKGAALKEEAEHLFRETLSTPGTDSLRRVKELVLTGVETVREDRKLESDGRDKRIPTGAGDNVASILDRSFGIMNCAMARQSIALAPPDILVSLPYDTYQGVTAYARAGEIIEKGRELMSRALDRYEA
jgi:NTE family protein